MKSFFDSFIREPLRKILLRMLIVTEKKKEEKPISARKMSLLRKDIHIPPVIVALITLLFMPFVLLFGAGRPLESLFSLCLFALLIHAALILYLKYDFPDMTGDDEAMMLLGTLLILFASILGALKRWPASYYLTPLPAASILAALLLHTRISIVLTVVLSLVFGVIHGLSFECFFMGFFGGVAGIVSASRIRSQKDFIHAGLLIGLSQLLTHSALTLLHPAATWSGYLWGALWTLSNGLLSSTLALGLLPFFESFFLRVSPLKLLELADFNQPLLKRLMVEAPGTYHHSLMVATISEAAARAIGANALLCRVGAYYHDVGKLVKPEYFIENQGGLGRNPHGNLAPALSSLVVISHVKEGIALAQEAKIPPEIIQFIPMHHGTGRIEYFYHQAVEESQESLFDGAAGSPDDQVREENYRYPGPKPHSRETAIVMLADSIEAASRTLEEPSHLRFKDLVERLVRKKASDGQLSSSPLTLSDLNRVQDSFINTLTTIYHARIEYPEEEGN